MIVLVLRVCLGVIQQHTARARVHAAEHHFSSLVCDFLHVHAYAPDCLPVDLYRFVCGVR